MYWEIWRMDNGGRMNVVVKVELEGVEAGSKECGGCEFATEYGDCNPTKHCDLYGGETSSTYSQPALRLPQCLAEEVK